MTHVIVKSLEFMFKACKLAGRLLIHTQIRNLLSALDRNNTLFKLQKVMNIQS